MKSFEAGRAASLMLHCSTAEAHVTGNVSLHDPHDRCWPGSGAQVCVIHRITTTLSDARRKTPRLAMGPTFSCSCQFGRPSWTESQGHKDTLSIVLYTLWHNVINEHSLKLPSAGPTTWNTT